MRSLLFSSILFLGISCSKSNDPAPVAYTDILGTWQIENSGVTITFDVIKVKYPSLPNYPKPDSLFATNESVTYIGKTGKSDVGQINRVVYKDGFYTFTLGTGIGICPVCVSNTTQLASFLPNSTFTEMIGHESDPNLPYYGSWVSVVGYDGTTDNHVLFLKEPLILKRIKGPY